MSSKVQYKKKVLEDIHNLLRLLSVETLEWVADGLVDEAKRFNKEIKKKLNKFNKFLETH